MQGTRRSGSGDAAGAGAHEHGCDKQRAGIPEAAEHCDEQYSSSQAVHSASARSPGVF